MTRYAVLGLGNVLMGDDALGPFVIALLRSCYDLPDEVAALDLGTPGLGLTTYVGALDGLIFVDALRGSRAPGRVAVFRGDAALSGVAARRWNAHGPGIDATLRAWRLQSGSLPETVLIGAVAQSVELGRGLSPPLRRAVPHVAAAVVCQLTRWGLRIGRPSEVRPPDIWWEPQSRTPPGSGSS